MKLFQSKRAPFVALLVVLALGLGASLGAGLSASTGVESKSLFALVEVANTYPLPAPSTALIFGFGLLAASGMVKRTGDLE